MAGVLEAVTGSWGGLLISIGLIISVGGALLAWTLLVAESVFTPAKGRVMPAALAMENAQGVPGLYSTVSAAHTVFECQLSRADFPRDVDDTFAVSIQRDVRIEVNLARRNLCRPSCPATARHG